MIHTIKKNIFDNTKYKVNMKSIEFFVHYKLGAITNCHKLYKSTVSKLMQPL